MTPAARLSAAIQVLDQILAGEAAEKALTNWGRNNRFAGSGDRAAIRDHVYDALRCRRSFAALGGKDNGRGLVLGGVRSAGLPPDDYFTGEGHAPAPLDPSDEGRVPNEAEALDLPDWIIPLFDASLGSSARDVALAMRSRAPVFLRVNLMRGTREQAIAALRAENIAARPHPLSKTALEVLEGQRKIQNAQAYLDGRVELQDASSQAVVERLPLRDGMRVLDHCAGGGGKTLAMLGLARLRMTAHDISPARMKDLPQRAKRAGVKVTLTERPEANTPYDLVFADVPCSGSGSWRRDPQGKWSLTPEKLESLMRTQAQILNRIAPMVAPAGYLAYATCSVLSQENGHQIEAFLQRSPGWKVVDQHQFTPLDGGDGFFSSILTRI